MRLPLLLAALAIPRACTLHAQPTGRSPFATLTQVLGHTEVTMRFRRPVARGRELFGTLVPWGRVWSPSADTAAVITFTTNVAVEGKPLAAGSYSLWAIPNRDEWTIVFSSAQPTFHLRYAQDADVLRVQVRPTPGPHVETLAFYFPMVDADSSTLVLHWGETVVPMSIKSRP
jgi:hypothetical protein